MQVDRRTILKSATSVSLLSLPGIAAAMLPGPTRFVYDDRFPAARALARMAQQEGIAATWFSGDLTRLWREELRGDCQASGGAIAGVTTPRALFCLEQLSVDHGWRISTRDASFADGALVRWTLAPRRPWEGRQ